MVSYSKYLYDGRLHRYSRSLVKNGHHVDVIGLGFKKDLPVEVIDQVRIFRIQSRNFHESRPFSYFTNLITFFFKSFYCVTKMQQKMKYDVIHFHNIPDFGVFCTMIAKCSGAKVILDIHDLVPEFYMRKFNATENQAIIRFLRAVEKISCSYADHVITVTDLWKETLEKRSIQTDKCTVIMNTPIIDVFKPIPFVKHKKDSSFQLSYHGNLAEQTGVDILLESLALLKEKIPNIFLQIIGEGRERVNLMEKTAAMGLEKRVKFIPVLPVTELPNQMKNVHAAVDPKRDGVYAGETLSVKSMEYLGMQIPLIASKTKAAEYYFNDDEVCFFSPDNPDDLARAIMNLYTSETRRKQLHRNAKLFNNRYNWQMMSDRYIRLIESLIHPVSNS